MHRTALFGGLAAKTGSFLLAERKAGFKDNEKLSALDEQMNDDDFYLRIFFTLIWHKKYTFILPLSMVTQYLEKMAEEPP